MSGTKTAIVTGATGAIGIAITGLMLKNNFNVVMVARNEEKAKSLLKAFSDDRLSYVLADLSRKKDIIRIAGIFQKSVDVLINNAATTPKVRTETPEGIEMQWATNVLGYFNMIKYFTPHLEKASVARVVNLASYWAGGLDLKDPEFKKRRYDNDLVYRQSKQADRMLSLAFAEKLKDKNITVNAAHPGDVNSKLSNDLGFGGSESPEQGAATPVWLAVDEQITHQTGKYFEQKKESYCTFCQQIEAVEELYNLCESY